MSSPNPITGIMMSQAFPKSVNISRWTLALARLTPVNSMRVSLRGIMKKILRYSLNSLCLTALLVVPLLRADDDPPPREFNGATPLQWSVRMADSEMARRGDSAGLERRRRRQMGLHHRSVHALAAQAQRARARIRAYFKFAETPSARSLRRTVKSTVTKPKNTNSTTSIPAKRCWRFTN